MKKSIKYVTIIAVVAVVLLLTLTGCSQTPYDQYLNIKWDKTAKSKEVATYSYTYEKTGQETLTGTLTTTIYEAKDHTFNIGSKEFADVKDGTFYEYELNVSNGDRLYGSAYFKGYHNQFFRPVEVYSERKIDGKTSSFQTTYSSNSLKTIYTENGVSKTLNCNFNKKGLVFDNVQLHAIARTLNFGQNGQLAFETPIFENGSLYAKKVAMGGTSRINYNVANKDNEITDKTFEFVNNGEKFGAVIVVLTINEKPAGIPQRIVVADKPYSINGTTFDQAVLRIEEGNKDKGLSTYVLTGMEKVMF